MALRARNSAILIKVETTEGVDASPTTTDALQSFQLGRSLNPDVIEDQEFRGGLGSGEPVIGAFRPQITLASNLIGSGTPTTAPRLAPLMLAAALVETVNSTAMPTSGTTTVDSGTATSVTFDRTVGGNTAWPNTSGALVGQPVELAGNPSTPTVAIIRSYTVAGNNVTIGLAATFSPALSGTTTIKRLPHVLYAPGAPTPHPSLTAYLYRDGILEKFLGCRTNIGFTCRGGNKWTLETQLNGVLSARSDASVPVDSTVLPSPAIWTNGICTLDSVEAAVSQLSIDLGNTGQFPTNPNQLNGLDPYVVGSRKVTGSFDPTLTLVATRNLLATLAAQTKVALAAMLGGKTGGVAGNRYGLFVPNAKLMDNALGEDGIILRETVPFQASGFINEFYLTHF